MRGEGLSGIMANVLDCNIIVSEIELHLHYYIHFQTNALLEKYEPPYPSQL